MPKKVQKKKKGKTAPQAQEVRPKDFWISSLPLP